MIHEVSVSDLSTLVSSLELVLSTLVLMHHDKAALAAKLTEVAQSIHAADAQAQPRAHAAAVGDYDVIMSFARLAQDALHREYQRRK